MMLSIYLTMLCVCQLLGGPLDERLDFSQGVGEESSSSRFTGFEVPIVRKLFNDFKDEKRKLSGDNDKNIHGSSVLMKHIYSTVNENGLRQAELDLSDEPGFGNQSNLLPIQDLAKEFESHKESDSNETKEDQVLLSDSALVSLSKSKSDQISNPSTKEDQVLLSDSALVSLSKSKSDQISNPSTKEDQVLLTDSALVSLSTSKSDQHSNPSTPEALDLKDETSKNSDLSKSTTVKTESEAVNDQFNITSEVHQNIEIGPETSEDYADESIDALNEEDFSVTAHNSVDSITDIALATTSTDDNKKKKDSTEVVDAGAAHYIYMMDQHDVTMSPLDVSSARSSKYDDVDIKLLESTEFPESQKQDGTNDMSETIKDSRQATDLEKPKKMDETEDMYGTIEDSEETSGTEDRDGRIVNTQGSRRNTQSGPNRVSLGSRLSPSEGFSPSSVFTSPGSSSSGVFRPSPVFTEEHHTFEQTTTILNNNAAVGGGGISFTEILTSVVHFLLNYHFGGNGFFGILFSIFRFIFHF
ncbi:uncharacterized protein LOC111696787 isoform X2 [Eurytemora carolleeae]|uniref:uncharacterized protein LOC111696787 isoform X2 n=1 Tax=Eurytemora carolleeae TaxID=1294199 RepID=UPI000C794F9B|nr:uncharacterized protein LOC111696787 isoform X2 [Eurytemora carolleeae]|eukprot:XP_023322288.1 uncharacterized protein LOC111696787 isoform X2 [Eurytemora affinis]